MNNDHNRLAITTHIVKDEQNMDSESSVFKTAELVRDTLGCYYFVCLQCGKYFENLDDTVDHIEKYFYDDDDSSNLIVPMTYNDTDCDGDVDTVVTNIKKESFEEYEEYKVSIPEICYDDDIGANAPIYCPICAKTLSYDETSLTFHLMKVHHRTRKHAQIYECKICGRNTFTRSYDLHRHERIHNRLGDAPVSFGSVADASVSIESVDIGSVDVASAATNVKCKIESTASVLYDILSQSDNEPVSDVEHKDDSVDNSAKVLPSSSKSERKILKRKIVQETDLEPLQVVKTSAEVVNNNESSKVNSYCPICQVPLPETETLESHLIQVHRRNKQYAEIYECSVCGKNTFTRPYDVRRHELIHSRATPADSPIPQPTPPTTNSREFINQFQFTKKRVIVPSAKLSTQSSTRPSTKPTIKKPEMINNADISNYSEEINTTNPKKNGILCAICNEQFDSYLDVTMHLKLEHNQKRIYKCRHLNCGQDSFTSAFALHRHEISHSIHYRNVVVNNQNRMKCVFCRRNFNKKWNLMKHEKRHLLEIANQ